MEYKGQRRKTKKDGEQGQMRPERSANDEAMRYLEYRARTSLEVQRHLKEKGYPEEECISCMEFLAECHFVDDRDYCFRYIEYAMGKGRGPSRIRQELSQKGIPGPLLDEGMEELYDSRTQKKVAMAQAKKALGLSVPAGQLTMINESEPGDLRCELTEKELAKAARRLAGQGFSSSVVYDVLGRLKKL